MTNVVFPKSKLSFQEYKLFKLPSDVSMDSFENWEIKGELANGLAYLCIHDKTFSIIHVQYSNTRLFLDSSDFWNKQDVSVKSQFPCCYELKELPDSACLERVCLVFPREEIVSLEELVEYVPFAKRQIERVLDKEWVVKVGQSDVDSQLLQWVNHDLFREVLKLGILLIQKNVHGGGIRNQVLVDLKAKFADQSLGGYYVDHFMKLCFYEEQYLPRRIVYFFVSYFVFAKRTEVKTDQVIQLIKKRLDSILPDDCDLVSWLLDQGLCVFRDENRIMELVPQLQLPWEPKQRLVKLYQRKPIWNQRELTPFLKDCLCPNETVEQIIAKYCKSSVGNKQGERQYILK